MVAATLSLYETYVRGLCSLCLVLYYRFVLMLYHLKLKFISFFCRRERFFDLLGDDSLVLHRLIYTLAIILHAAVYTTVRAFALVQVHTAGNRRGRAN